MIEDTLSQTDIVTVEFENGIAWVTLNRPEKRNCLNPATNDLMTQVLDDLETDERCKVLVLTGADPSFCAGMDLKEYFEETAAKGHMATRKAQRSSYGWFRRLRWFERPTIAAVNGWCFGGAFGPLYSCDLAIAADEAVFGVSEINWGIIPGGNVTKVLAELMNFRNAMYYILTGETFDGKQAAEMGLVNYSVPHAELKDAVRKMATKLLDKNPETLKAAKDAFRRVLEMPVDAAEDYLVVRQEALNWLDKSGGREKGLKQFIHDKTYKPGLGAYDLSKK